MNTFDFDLPIGQSSIIKVIGVGGGGGNAVNHMFQQGITGVDFIVCNTDAQALDHSPVSNKVQLGPELTRGLGAGSLPEKGRDACEESAAELRELLQRNTRMVFITAGMGGGTGTGAAPVVARIARELGILTVGIVTTPFSFEGNRKFRQALAGIEELKKNVDTVIVISNDKISKMYGSLRKSEAFNLANNILTTAAKGISEIITIPGEINVDFADVEYVMSNGGTALMGNGCAEGEGRAVAAVKSALSSPLLNDSSIVGAQKILLNITAGVDEHQVTIDEITSINEYLQLHAKDTDIIFGSCDDAKMGAKLAVTLIATGFTGGEVIQQTDIIRKEVVQLQDDVTLSVKPESNVQEIIPLIDEQDVLVVENVKLPDNFVVEQVELYAAENEAEVEQTKELGDWVGEVEKPYTLFDMLDVTEQSETDSMQIEYVLRGEQSTEETIHVQDEECEPFEMEENHELSVTVEEDFSIETAEQFTEEQAAGLTVETSEIVSDEVINQEEVIHSDMQSTMGVPDSPVAPVLNAEEERRRRLNRLSFRLEQQRDLSQMENEPAWKRRGVDIGNPEGSRYSTSSAMSRYTLGDSPLDDQNLEIRKNGNSFLDAVD